MERYIAGLDVGGTTGRLIVKNVLGQVLGEFYGQGCSINTDGAEKSEKRYRNLVLPALEEKQLKPEDCMSICIAASGIDSPEFKDACRRAFLKMGFRDKAILVQNDCEIFLNLSKGPSLVLVSGTGSICYGRDLNGTVVRTGGWGHILSDEGSGFHIGMGILKLVGDHLDGRAHCPLLYEKVREQTAISSLFELNEFVNANLMNKAVIGALAPLAEFSYVSGGDAGVFLIKESAKVLADLVKDTCSKMNLKQEEEACLWLWGSVLIHNEPLRAQMETLVKQSYGNLDIKIPQQRALDVAIEAAEKHMRS